MYLSNYNFFACMNVCILSTWNAHFIDGCFGKYFNQIFNITPCCTLRVQQIPSLVSLLTYMHCLCLVFIICNGGKMYYYRLISNYMILCKNIGTHVNNNILSCGMLSRYYVKSTNANMPNANMPNVKVPNIVKTSKCRIVKLLIFKTAETTNCRCYKVPNSQIVDI
jgi:hypothetical protein